MKLASRYQMISLHSADTYRINDTKSGETVSIMKGQDEAKKRLDVLNKQAVVDTA